MPTRVLNAETEASTCEEPFATPPRARYAARTAGDMQLLASAEHNLAAQQYQLSQVTGTAHADQSRLLDRAEASGLESARLSPVDQSPLRFGHAWTIVGKIRSARGDRVGAIEAFATALTGLSADMGPSEAREASRLLLELAEAQDDVKLAADAAAQLVQAVAAVISAHSRADDRMSEHRGPQTTDSRFAAHALVCAGRLEEAAIALELGRTRELGLLMLAEGIDLEALSHIDPSLHAEVEELVAAVPHRHPQPGGRLHLGSLRSGSRESAPRCDRLRRSRRLSLLRLWMRSVWLAEPQRPLAYLGSAPKGSFCIIVYSDEDGGTALEAIHAPDCDSQAIANLAIGLEPDGTQVASVAYLAAQMYQPELLDEALAAFSPLIGEKLLRPLADSLARRGASSVTLIPRRNPRTHAVTRHVLERHGSDSADLDRGLRCDVRALRSTATCLHAARVPGTKAMQFALSGLPTLSHIPTPWTVPNSRSKWSRASCQPGDHLVLKGEQATKERVLDELPSATHVHFACHGGGRFLDPLLSAALSLSGEELLSAREIAGLSTPARLVVASACETGVVQGYYEVDESLGLSSAFVAAGGGWGYLHALGGGRLRDSPHHFQVL